MGMSPGSDGITRPLVEGAEGGFPGTKDGAWCLSSSSLASACTQSQGKWQAGGGKSLKIKVNKNQEC